MPFRSYQWRAERTSEYGHKHEREHDLGTFANEPAAKSACQKDAGAKLTWTANGKTSAYAPDPREHYTTYTVTRVARRGGR